MAGRRRDYRGEYARRIEKGRLKGLSRAQARGHPKPLENLTTRMAEPPSFSRRLEAGFRAIREGKSLIGAAKEIHVSPERLRHYLREQGIAERRGRRWVALNDQRQRRMLIYSDGQAITVTVDRATASTIGHYMSAVGRFLETNDPTCLIAFEDRDVTDVRGRPHPLETDPNTLYSLAHTSDETFEQVYRIVLP